MYTDCVPRTGRPPKPESEKFVGLHIKFPPALAERLRLLVKTDRAAFIRDAIEAALKKLERQRAKGGEDAD